MADIFSTGPSRAGYLGAASNGFLAAKPAGTSGMDSFASSIGDSLANIGIGASGMRKKKPTAMEQLKLQQDQAKDAARAQIADILSTANLDNIQEGYARAAVIGARAGLTQDEVDKPFQGVALARGAQGSQVSRLGSHGSFGADTYFTGDEASAGRKQTRENTLADTAAGIAEQQRKEGVTDQQRRAGEGATLSRERELQGRREGSSTALENLRFQHEQDLKGPPKPAVPLSGLDELRKGVTNKLSDELGVLPTKEGDLPPDQVQADPGVTEAIMKRASELMDAPNNLSAVDAIQQATTEKADLTGTTTKGGINLPLFGNVGGSQVKTVKKGTDPLGIRN